MFDDANLADPIRRVHSEIIINATAHRVWSILTDIDQMPGMHPQMLTAHWLDGASEAALGARFSSQNVHHELGIWESTSRIVELCPDRVMAWTIEGGFSPPAVCRFELTADDSSGEERTRLGQTYFVDTRLGALPPVSHARTGCR